MQALTWKVSVHSGSEESCCQIHCSALSWDFSLWIPRKDERLIFNLGNEDSKLTLLKVKTLIGWGTDSFRLITPDGVEHHWSIAFDTGIAAFIEAILRILALGLIPKKNENWVLGSTVGKKLSYSDQQKLLILNATIRMCMLPNDFSSGG
jgi:hypothetical protein